MERSWLRYVRLLAMYLVDLVGISPTSYRLCSLHTTRTLSFSRPKAPRPPSPRMALNCLPAEILLCISDHLQPRDINALVQTSTPFAALFSRELYDFVVGIRTSDDEPQRASLFNRNALSYAGRWQSPYVLDYFRVKRADVLLREDAHGFLLFNEVVRCGNLELTKILLERGADIHRYQTNDTNGLTLAALGGYPDIVRFLLDQGADIQGTEPSKKTLLHTLYQHGRRNPEVFQIVVDQLKRRNEISKQNIRLDTPLHYAARYNRVYAVSQLLEAGADLTKLNTDGLSVLDVAFRSKNDEIIGLLLQASPGPWPSRYIEKALWKACEQLDLDMVNRIVAMSKSKHITINFSHVENNRSASTPLHAAARGPQDGTRFARRVFHRKEVDTLRNWEAIMNILLDVGVNIFARDRMGRTPLLYAIEGGQPEKMQFLLTKLGSTLPIPDRMGRSSLHAAVHASEGELIARHLIRHGVDINAQDSLGQTALHYAAASPTAVSVLEFLLAAGADTSIVDKASYPAIHFAAVQKRDGSLKAFVDARVDVHQNCELCHLKTMQWKTDDGKWKQDPPDLNDLFNGNLVCVRN
ncbi:hypothetical protein LOZ37_003197 [Ophidiomyces ophidiicola]|nr:hypothetical protein LOZ37_003197 [Ophidiomyces ophidiicola]